MSAILVALAAAAEPAQAKGGLPQLEPSHFAPQLIWLAITFAALYALLSRVALPRIAEVLDERRDRIQRDLAEAERLKGETEKALAEYEQELASARGRATALGREKRESLAAEVDRERARVEAAIAAKLAEGESQIAGLKQRALTQVNDIAADTAQAIVNKLVGQDVGAAEVRSVLEPAAGE